MSKTNETIVELHPPVYRTAALDEAHIGDINGAFGTIRHGDHGPRIGSGPAAERGPTAKDLSYGPSRCSVDGKASEAIGCRSVVGTKTISGLTR
jgi:hypothetical protein